MSKHTPVLFSIQQNSQRDDATVLAEGKSETRKESSAITTQHATSYRSAIQACPVEILVEIFMYHLAGNLTNTASKVESISLVCQGWNHLVAHTPVLWTHINILPLATQGPPPRGLLKQYIQRSKQRLLHVNIVCDQVKIKDKEDSLAWRAVFYLLYGSIHRLETLHVTLPEDIYLSMSIFGIFQQSAPNLVELRVENFDWRVRQSFSFSKFPRLRTLELGSGYVLKQMITHLSLPSIQSLEIDLQGFEMWRDERAWTAELSSLYSLTSLGIRNTGWTRSEMLTPEEGDSIVLPRLEKLAIWGIEGINRVRFFLPNLQTLAFDCDILKPCFPKVDPPEVIWRPEVSLGWSLVLPLDTKRFLQAILLQYPRSTRFVVPDWAEGALIAVLQAFQREGNTLEPSVSFMIESSSGQREAVELQQIIVAEVLGASLRKHPDPYKVAARRALLFAALQRILNKHHEWRSSMCFGDYIAESISEWSQIWAGRILNSATLIDPLAICKVASIVTYTCKQASRIDLRLVSSMAHRTSIPPRQTLGSKEIRIPLDIYLSTRLQAESLNSNVTAIEKCPVEVLTDIFLYYLEDGAHKIENLLFACRHWYLLIKNTPLFWTHIAVSINGPPASKGTPLLRLVKAFTEKSESMLLDIKVDCSRVKDPSIGGAWHVYAPALDLLRDSMHRWRTLDIILPVDRSLSGSISTLLKGSAPNLVKLSAQNFQYRYHQPVCFSELSNLKTLRLDVYPFKKMIDSLPLASLHSLDIDLEGLDTWIMYHGYSNWTADVSLLRSLHSLQIRYTGVGRTRTDSSPTPVSLPLLQELGIWNLPSHGILFELPALQTLMFDGLRIQEISPVEVVWRPAFGPTLRYLEGFLKAALVYYRSAKRIVVPHWAENVMVDTLRELRKEGIIVSSSVLFMKERSNGEREVIEIHDAIEG